jgi:hypothetical protein
MLKVSNNLTFEHNVCLNMSCAAITEYRRMDSLQTTKFVWVTGLEAGSPRWWFTCARGFVLQWGIVGDITW